MALKEIRSRRIQVKIVKCANDTAILAMDEKVLQYILDKLFKVEKNYETKLNIQKNKLWEY